MKTQTDLPGQELMADRKQTSLHFQLKLQKCERRQQILFSIFWFELPILNKKIKNVLVVIGLLWIDVIPQTISMCNY